MAIKIKLDIPELEKMEKVKDKSQVIGEFLDWLLNEREFVIARWDGQEYSSHLAVGYLSIEKLLAEYFEIDLDKVEKEKRKILAAIRLNH